MKRIFAYIMVSILVLALTACSRPAGVGGTCTFTEERSATQDATGATGVNIKSQAGTVKVIGRAGLQEVQVTATACAASEEALKQIKLTTERSSDGWVRILVDLPRGNNTLDLTVEVPEDLVLMARNDNGTLDVSRVYKGVNVRGDNGTISVTDVKGGVTAEIRAGAVTITRVEGNVNVTRADKGILVITGVKGNVALTKKTGAVAVTDVAGTLTVTQKVKGLVTYDNISGKVSVPN